ncbi:uncharacterized protein LOC120140927 [Hibiscus syriacus]|uniref:uncharacterized protein LOC120140927 n=1 Tax=Hibiscus syriacus TaxID=106335 RepID=UPI001924EB75|nr:uncharacterized protein LOC120140927 [Hibiscus syriacus]
MSLSSSILVVKRTLNIQSPGDEQRDNIFHTKCYVEDKVCIMIIDIESCTNVASTHVVEKLGLKTSKHPHPYKLWSITNLGTEQQIDFIPGATIPNRPAYQSNPKETKELQKQVKELLEKGNIRERLSPCVVLVLLVLKKDGTWRMCIDCRVVNQITIKYSHSIPQSDDMLDELSGASIFSKIDLKSGYHHIRMKEGDEWKIAFKTKQGFIVSSQDLEVNPEKIKAIQEWPRPTNISQVQSFYGLASFYRRYVLLNTLNSKLLGFAFIKEQHATDLDFGEKYLLCETCAHDKYYQHDGYLFKE